MFGRIDIKKKTKKFHKKKRRRKINWIRRRHKDNFVRVPNGIPSCFYPILLTFPLPHQHTGIFISLRSALICILSLFEGKTY